MSGKFIAQPNVSVPKSTDARTLKFFARSAYLRSLLSMLLLSMLYAFPAHSQCVHWYHAAGEKFNNGLEDPSNLRIFGGNVGDQQIRMSLHYDVADNSIDGFYGYNNQPGTLTVHGQMRSSGAGMDLVERNVQGKTTGYFSLLFTYPTGRDYNAAWVQKHASDYDCSYVTGTWHSASDNHPIKVQLNSMGEQTPAEQQARALNDEAAYRVQKALLRNDRKGLASALKYPFCTSRHPGGVTWWNTPDDVIAHYKQIAKLADPLSLRPAVPHAIETVGKLSYWIGDSMEFEDGKMQAMCDGSCFHSECYHP